MRRVIIQGTPPADWVADAKAVTDQLRAAKTKAKRAKIIKANESLWRDDRIRDWLLQQFANKCWYTEAYESVSSVHVDHYRPKGRSKDLEGNKHEGYWWLTFDWTNYRICGQLINVKKSDIFPFADGVRADLAGTVSLKLESPILIDPLTDQTRLISFEKDEDDCIAVPSDDLTDAEDFRAKKTIDILGLNRLPRLKQKRAEYWNQCRMTIIDYNTDGPQALRCVQQLIAVNKLREMVAYKAEFSSVSEACILKTAPSHLIASVFQQMPIA